MKDNLGYRFKKDYQKRLTLIERPNIQAWRAKYLRRMKENNSLGADKKPVIYIDETWIHAHYTYSKKVLAISYGCGSKIGLVYAGSKVPKKYIMDKLLAEHGHEVVRLPPYNCDLNPIEYIWNLVKQRVFR